MTTVLANSQGELSPLETVVFLLLGKVFRCRNGLKVFTQLNGFDVASLLNKSQHSSQCQQGAKGVQRFTGFCLNVCSRQKCLVNETVLIETHRDPWGKALKIAETFYLQRFDPWDRRECYKKNTLNCLKSLYGNSLQAVTRNFYFNNCYAVLYLKH